MSTTTMPLPSQSWASAHRAALAVLALVMALAVATAVALFVTRTDAAPAAPNLPAVELVPDACHGAVPGSAC